MSDIDVLQEYAKFRAAGAVVLEVESSATDVHLIDVAAAADLGGTDPSVTRRAFEQQRRSYPGAPRSVESVSTIGGPNFLILISEQGEQSIFASMGDFVALDDLRTPEGQIWRQIPGLRGAPGLIYCERLARRLAFLLETMKEEEEAWNEGSPESLRKMLMFLQTVPNFRYPTVTVTPSATFRAQWTTDPSRHFAVEFLPDGQVRFVVFCPDPRHPNRVQRHDGITSTENLMNVVEPYKVHRWAADAGA